MGKINREHMNEFDGNRVQIMDEFDNIRKNHLEEYTQGLEPISRVRSQLVSAGYDILALVGDDIFNDQFKKDTKPTKEAVNQAIVSKLRDCIVMFENISSRTKLILPFTTNEDGSDMTEEEIVHRISKAISPKKYELGRLLYVTLLGYLSNRMLAFLKLNDISELISVRGYSVRILFQLLVEETTVIFKDILKEYDKKIST